MDGPGLGFVGLGRAAGRLADSAIALPSGYIAAVCSGDALKAASFGEQHSARRWYTDYDQMLADPAVTGVVIASANAGHADQALRAAAAGKHVFCEKPMGRDGSEARQIERRCQEFGVTLGVGYHLRYHPLIQQARDAIARGAIGDVRLIRGHFYVGTQYDRSGWRSEHRSSGGGALVSTGVHVIDSFHFLLQTETVDASMACDQLPVEEVCNAMLTFRNGAFGMFDTSRLIPNANGSNDIEIFGDRGRCLLLGVLGGWVPNGSGFIENEKGRTDFKTDLSRNLYREELADWIDAFLHGRTPLSDGAAGVSAASAMDALYRHARVCAPSMGTAGHQT